MEQTIPSWAEKKENIIKIENAIRKADDQLINLSADVPEWIQEKILDIAMELRESTGEPRAEAFFEMKEKERK